MRKNTLAIGGGKSHRGEKGLPPYWEFAPAVKKNAILPIYNTLIGACLLSAHQFSVHWVLVGWINIKTVCFQCTTDSMLHWRHTWSMLHWFNSHWVLIYWMCINTECIGCLLIRYTLNKCALTTYLINIALAKFTLGVHCLNVTLATYWINAVLV